MEKKKVTDEQLKSNILNRIKRLYETEKGKKFIAHLISAFLPDKYKIVINNDTGESLRCAITSTHIFSLSESPGGVVNEKSAFYSESSTKVISKLSLDMLSKFVNDELINENNHIKLALKPRKDIKEAVAIPEETKKTKNIPVENKKSDETEKEFIPATYSLADNAVLSNLMKELLSVEK